MPPFDRPAGRHLVAAAALLTSLLSACSSAPGGLLDRITPYRVEVVQGNVVTREQLALLKVGMSRLQTRDIMGSPLMVDPFHANRWDYVFTIRRQGAEPQQRAIVLRFDGESLKSIDAPELPSEREFVASIDTFKRKGEPAPLSLTEEQREALPVPPARPASAAEPTGPTRDYPPLESGS